MLPPELMGGGPPPMMGGPPPGMMMGGFPEGMPAEQEAPPASASDLLQQMIDLATAYGEQEDDQQNRLLIEQARTIIQKILANEQKLGDDLMQGKASPAALRRYAP